MNQIKNKFIFLVPALISLLIMIYMILENQMLGFPDGHLTDLDKALRVFYKIAIPVSTLLLLSFVLMSFSSLLKRKIRLIFLYSFSILILAGIIVVYYLNATLDNGVGG